MTLVAAPSSNDLSLCIPDLKSKKKDAALAEMVAAGCERGLVSEGSLLLELLRLRERLGTTAIGKGVALPNTRSLTVREPRIIVARAARGIEWGAPDDLLVSLVLMVLAPSECSDEAWHTLLARAAASARLQRTRQKMLTAPLEHLSGVLREALA
jgi:mannitol/fructose-specific phosphotransferase system IIA component (Ntr-type)